MSYWRCAAAVIADATPDRPRAKKTPALLLPNATMLPCGSRLRLPLHPTRSLAERAALGHQIQRARPQRAEHLTN